MGVQKVYVLQCIIVVAALIIISGASIIFLLLRYRDHKHTFHEKINEINADHEKLLAQNQLDIREQTLQDVSRDIHDNIALGLTLSKLHLHTISLPGATKFSEKIDLSIRLIEEAIHNLSDLSKSLNADPVRQFGLIRSVEAEVNHLRETGVFSVNFEIQGNPVKIEQRKEIAVFRMVQEALKNIIKHAEADSITIIISFESAALDIIIRDNGKGFTPDETLSKKGAGINNMQQRAKIINCRCDITSFPGKGSSIRIQLPFQITDEKRPTYNG